MRIKQWIANWLFKNVRIQQHDKIQEGYLPGHSILGDDWVIDIPGEPGPVKPPEPEYVPRYNTRTTLEHQAIRNKIQYDPKNCLHLKGGRAVKSVTNDYNVLTHTFPNGKTRIRCANCSRVWWSTDADWQDAVKMMNNSTNMPSSSEVRMVYQPKAVYDQNKKALTK